MSKKSEEKRLKKAEDQTHPNGEKQRHTKLHQSNNSSAADVMDPFRAKDSRNTSRNYQKDEYHNNNNSRRGDRSEGSAFPPQTKRSFDFEKQSDTNPLSIDSDTRLYVMEVSRKIQENTNESGNGEENAIPIQNVWRQLKTKEVELVLGGGKDVAKSVEVILRHSPASLILKFVSSLRGCVLPSSYILLVELF